MLFWFLYPDASYQPLSSLSTFYWTEEGRIILFGSKVTYQELQICF